MWELVGSVGAKGKKSMHVHRTRGEGGALPCSSGLGVSP